MKIKSRLFSSFSSSLCSSAQKRGTKMNRSGGEGERRGLSWEWGARPGTKGARGPRAPRPRGKPGRPRAGDPVGPGARPPGAAQAPLPGPGWKSRCAPGSRVCKVGGGARSRRPRAALSCTGAAAQLSAEPWTPGSRERRGARARARAPAGPPIPGPGPRPRTHGWGRRGVAARRAGVKPWRLPAGGLGTAWPAPPQLPGGPAPQPPTSRTPRHAEGAASRLRSWAGPGVLGQSPGRAGHGGSIIHGAPRAPLPRPALPSASPEKWGRRQGKKVPRAKLATLLVFPK